MVLLAVIGLAITVLTRASGRHAEVPPTPLQAAPALPVAPTPERDPVPALQASKPHEPALDPRGDGDDSGAFSVRVDLDAPEIRGHLSTEAVHRVLRRHSNEVRYCYERELRGSPELAGDVRIRAIVSPTGLVQTAMVQSTSLHNTSVERCILQAVQRWPFPAPEGGGIVIFNQRFVLSRD